MISVSAGFGGQNPSTKFRILKNSGEVFSASGLSGLTKSTAGAGSGAGLPRNCDNGWTLYPAWIFLTLSMSSGLKLGPVKDEREFGLRPDHLLDAGRRFAMPVRPGEEEVARVIARGPAADIGEVEGVHVDELERVVTILVDRRDREHQRLGAQVRADK